MIILGSTKYSANLIQSSEQKGIEAADLPFDISADFIPAGIKSANKQNQSFGSGQAPETAVWDDIIYRSNEMEACISIAKKVALTDFDVLIEGESGTGKELFAKKQCKSFEEAADTAVDALRRQLKKYKDKHSKA